MISASILNERVTLERPVAAPDGYGGEITVWQAVVTDWAASVRPLSGRGENQTEALTGLSSYEVRMRLSPATEGADATWRVRWRGEVLKILGATVDRGRMREVRMQCEAGAGVAI